MYIYNISHVIEIHFINNSLSLFFSSFTNQTIKINFTKIKLQK